MSAYNLIPFSICYFIFAVLVGKLTSKISNKRFMVVGFLLSTFAYFLFAVATQTQGLWIWWAGMALFGIGFVSINTAGIPCAISFIPPERIGHASGMSMTIRWLGSAIGAAVVGILLDISSFGTVFVIIACVGVAGFLCSLLIQSA